MGGPSPRTFDELLRYVQQEIALLGRRRSSVTRDDIDALNLRMARSEEWAAKAGPLQHVGAPDGAYAVTWSKAVDSGGSIRAGDSSLYIQITEPGIYEVIARQRGSGSPANGYIGIGLNGSRTALQGRAGGVWDHDHTLGINSFSSSRYLGPLNAGERITSGAESGQGAGLRYGESTDIGTLTVRRIS